MKNKQTNTYQGPDGHHDWQIIQVRGPVGPAPRSPKYRGRHQWSASPGGRFLRVRRKQGVPGLVWPWAGPDPEEGSPTPAQSENPNSPEATFTTGTLSCTCTGTMLFFMGSKSPITPLLSWKGGRVSFQQGLPVSYQPDPALQAPPELCGEGHWCQVRMDRGAGARPHSEILMSEIICGL